VEVYTVLIKFYIVFLRKKWVAVKRTSYCYWPWPSLQTRSIKRENK